MKIKYPTLRNLITVSATAVLLASCASAPQAPEGAAAARAKLTRLQSDAQLASRAQIEIRDAELAVRAAEHPEKDHHLAEHLVLVADQKIETADAWAHSRLYEDQREELNDRAEAARLAARTREADAARSDASYARSDARSARTDADNARDAATDARSQTSAARSEAYSARTEADEAKLQAEFSRDQTQVARTDANTERNAANVARGQANAAIDQADAARSDASNARAQTERALQDTAAAQAETEELQLQIIALNAKATERGLVVTLGDVLFETGQADLKGGTLNDLEKLAAFLNKYPERTVLIEGHTDTVGSESSNQLLSQRRADSVQSYLVGQGVAASRLNASGKGELVPVSGNDTSTGRQQNRRVEVIISNTAE